MRNNSKFFVNTVISEDVLRYANYSTINFEDACSLTWSSFTVLRSKKCRWQLRDYPAISDMKIVNYLPIQIS